MAKRNEKEAGEYTAGQIQVLKGLEAVRKRPGMYIGSTSARGLHHLVYEVVDNSIDEAMAGYCSEVDVTIHADDSVTVVDDGRGIPVDVHPTEKVPGVELAMTTLHAGGKFDKNTYKVSGGLHGVGVSVVNALSSYLEVEIRRGGKKYHQRYERGIKVKELEEIGKSTGSGTRVTFKPDSVIFTELEYSYETLSNRLRELAFLNKGLRIVLTDERNGGQREEYQYEGGLAEYVTYLRGGRGALHEKTCYFEASRPEAEIAGYRDALHLLHDSAQRVYLSVGQIRSLHELLYRYLPIKGGVFKLEDNRIVEPGAQARAQARQVSPCQIPRRRRQL